MKFKLFMAMIVVILATNANAVDINCGGSVVYVMDYPGKCNGNSAFKTSASNGTWVCSTSKNGNAIVLSALVAKKALEVYIDSQNGLYTCATLPSYTPTRYVIINP